jgi:MoxR-like ATPase
MKISLGYPDRSAEKTLLQQGATIHAADRMDCCIDPADVVNIQEDIEQVTASDALLDYVQDILDFTRSSAHFHSGLSPRAGLAILQASRSWAKLYGRDYVIPEDIQSILPWVVSHRLRSAQDLTELPPDTLLERFREVPVP